MLHRPRLPSLRPRTFRLALSLLGLSAVDPVDADDHEEGIPLVESALWSNDPVAAAAMAAPTSSSNKLGRGVAKVFGVNLDHADADYARAIDPVTRGESVFSVATADSYIEDEPSVSQWLRDQVPDGHQVGQYFLSLFPFLTWIHRYNWQWFVGDLIAGVTIGAVVVPQGMGYAKLAELPIQDGLYSAFMGVLIYWFFATSKDITIGPVAVMSLLVGNIINNVTASHPHIQAQDIAATLAIIGGAIVFFIGIVRLGWLVDFISLTAVSAFITGSAINIICSQIGNLMGISSYYNTRASPYLVIINSLKNLKYSTVDAAMGLTALVMLYGIRFGFNYLAKHQPQRRKLWFFCNTLRTVFVLLLYTMISWLVNLHLKDHNSKYSPFALLGTVPRGFTEAGVPNVTTEIIKLVANQLPAVVIVLLVEHISIAKSFGRINNYTINPSQEMIAIGVTNLLGPFLGAYPATGSFSRTAIKSKAGVRTPLAGVITAIVVLLAVYALPAVFFYIPSASLAAVIIHAVGDLITPLSTVYRFWRISPIEVPIFLIGVIVMIFTNIEDGVYTVVSISAALLLWRIFKATGRFLGKVKVRSVASEVNGLGAVEGSGKLSEKSGDEEIITREIFLPINAEDGSNPRIQPQHPAPGIFIFRFSEGFTYPNAGSYLDSMVQQIFKTCRRTTLNAYARPGDRPWNDAGPSKHADARAAEEEKPTVKAVIIDFSSVNNVDVTSVQALIDVRNQLDRFAAPDRVQWHFAHIHNRWTRRALAAAGFGFPSVEDGGYQRWRPIFSVAELGGSDSAAAAAARDTDINLRNQQNRKVHGQIHTEDDLEAGSSNSANDHDIEKELRASVAYSRGGDDRHAMVQGLNRPFFHIDLVAALQSAIQNADVLANRTETVGSALPRDVHT